MKPLFVQSAVFVVICCLSWRGAQASEGGERYFSRIDVRGVERTRAAAIEELLPRPLPNTYSEQEIREFKRRTGNLQLFDHVSVGEEGTLLRVDVREKFSISPIVDLSTGKTLRDTSATLGAVENNIDGDGTRLGGYAKYSERGPQFSIWLAQHSYHPAAWQKEAEVFFSGSSFRFVGSPETWQRTRLGGDVEVKTPYSYSSALRYEFVVAAYRERLTLAGAGAVPKDGTFLGTASELIWDRYSWNDTTPRGVRITAEFRPGVFVGPAEPRFEARVEAVGAIPLGARSVVTFRATGEGVNAGNPNHSELLGSQRGVRGLPDTLYRDQAHAFANVEFRHAIEIAKRWYVQPVAFVDGAGFLPMDANGRATSWKAALAGGAGVRLIPTWLVKTLLRVDGAHLFTPTSEWFVQFGIDQYF